MESAVDMGTQRTFRAAIIGTGRIADLYDDETVHFPDISLPPGNVHANMYNVKPVSHAGAYRTTPGYELVAAANRGKERLSAFGERHGVSALYTDYKEMLRAEAPDVVSICTQSPDKCEVVLACAEAGVPAVIVEKAFATSLKEADAMLAACRKSGTFVAVHHPMRFSLMYRRLKSLALDGSIGAFGSIACYGGGLVHGGTHKFDFMRFVGGAATSVLARIPEIEPGGPDPLAATYPDLKGDALITFESGATGLLSGVSPSAGGMEIRGSGGYVTAPANTGIMKLVQTKQRAAAEFGIEQTSEGRPVRAVSWEEESPAWPTSLEADEKSAMQRLLTELHLTLTDGDPFISTGEEGAAALELAIACYQSALIRGPVSLPLENRELRVFNR